MYKRIFRAFLPLSLFLFFLLVFVGPVSAVTYGNYWDPCYGAGTSIPSMYHRFEWEYNVNLTGYVTDVNVILRNDWNFNYVTLYINGVDVGKPVNNGAICNAYFRNASWNNTDVYIDDEYVLFEIVKPFGVQVTLPVNTSDADGDGDTDWYIGYAAVADGVYNGNTEITTSEPMYWFELEGATTSDYVDDVFIHEDDVDMPNGFRFDVTSSNMNSDNYITVDDPLGAEVFNETMTFDYEFYIYYPKSLGTYYVNLTRGGVVRDSDSIVVNAAEYYSYIRFYPNPVFPGDVVTIEAKCNSSSYDGLLVCPILGLEYFLPNGDSCSFSYVPRLTGEYIFKLYRFADNETYGELRNEILYVVNNYGVRPYIRADFAGYVWDDYDHLIFENVNIRYSHPFVGSRATIEVYYGGQRLHYLYTDSTFGSTVWNNNYLYVGSYDIYLKLGDVVLAHCVYNIDEIPVTPESAWDYTGDDYDIVIGFMICVVVGCFAGFIAMNGLAFVAGFFGTLMFLSIPSQPFTFFPAIVLFLGGLVVVLMILDQLRR